MKGIREVGLLSRGPRCRPKAELSQACFLLTIACVRAIDERFSDAKVSVIDARDDAKYEVDSDAADVAKGFAPSMAHHDRVRYAPYLLNFFSSSIVEAKLTEKELWCNTTTSYAGTLFGSVVSKGVLVTSAMVLGPQHIVVDSYDQAALMVDRAVGETSAVAVERALRAIVSRIPESS